MATINDHLLVIVKSVAATTPIGSSVLTAINEYVPSVHDEALARAAKALGKRLDELEERIESENVRTDDFVDLFKNYYIVVQRTQHEEKLWAAANILTNYLLREGDSEKLEYLELDHFMRCLETLSIGALNVLGVAIRRGSLPGVGGTRMEAENVRVDFGTLHRELPSIDHNLLMGLLSELFGAHLLMSLGSPTVRLENYENYPIETTPLGYRFAKHILDN